jgi:ferrous iron transport protein B
MFVTFFATFTFGKYPQSWIETAVEWMASLLSSSMADGPLKDLLIDGVIGGVGGVIVFLPNILILFLFISFMEDTGYMARAAFITDKVMHKIGLHGKSFIPLVMGFGCNVPAIMATRTLENRNDRILTILISPFMSCSARLPVYIIIIGAFFSEHAALILFSMYGIGIFLAVIMARIFKKFIFKSKEAPFVMELPPYRMPVARVIIKHMWSKASQYLKKMGGIILIASIIIWALGYFPKDVDYSKDYDAIILETQKTVDEAKIVNDIQTVDIKTKDILNLELAKKEEHQKYSYIGRIGEAFSPIMEPLGFDWKMSVSLLSGIVAKEVIVSTMGVLYQADGSETYSLEYRLKTAHGLTPLVAFVFMLFILIYFPCLAVIVVVAKETSWKWAAFLAVYTTLMAWLICFVVFNVGVLLL